jgi:protein-tyrosine-phosphatase
MNLARVDAVTQLRLHAVAARLATEYEGVFAAPTVVRLVEDSAARLGDVTVTRFVPLLVERFARERLLSAARAERLLPKARPQLLFICTQNAGRSQMAAALARHVSRGAVEAMSAGSDPAGAIDGAVARVLNEIGVDVTLEFPKPLTEEVLRGADVVITMGCDEACPVLPGRRYLDWHIEDPFGRRVADVRRIRQDIADHVLDLLKELLQ